MKVHPSLLGKLYDLFLLNQNNEFKLNHYNVRYKGSKIRQDSNIISSVEQVSFYKKENVLELSFEVSGFPNNFNMSYDAFITLRDFDTNPKLENKNLSNFVSVLKQYKIENINKNNI